MKPSINIADRNGQINKYPHSLINAIRASLKCSAELIKKPEALTITCSSKSKHHTDILDGLVPPSISTGYRSVAYLKYEILAVVAAQIQGRSNEEIRLLVKELVAQRQNLFIGVQL